MLLTVRHWSFGRAIEDNVGVNMIDEKKMTKEGYEAFMRELARANDGNARKKKSTSSKKKKKK